MKSMTKDGRSVKSSRNVHKSSEKDKAAKKKPRAKPTPPGNREPTDPATSGLLSADELKGNPSRWLWEGRLELGTLASLVGAKGSGKTTIAAAIAAYITGGPKLRGSIRRKPQNVLWLPGEENAFSMIRPKLDAAGADLKRVFFPTCNSAGFVEKLLVLPDALDVLATWIEQVKAEAVILDPFVSFMASDRSSNDESQVRGFLDPLASLAARMNCLILGIRHPRKGGRGPAIDQSLGSGAWVHVPRAVLTVATHPLIHGRHALAVVAGNNSGKASTLTFDLEDAGQAPRVKWIGEEELTAEDLTESQGDAGERDMLTAATELIIDELDGGDKSAAHLLKQGEKIGCSARTMYRAKGKLKVGSEKVSDAEGTRWNWQKPEAGWPKRG